MNRTSVTGFILMVISAFFFAISGPVAKLLYTIDWSPGAVVGMRLPGAALMLLIPTVVAMRGRWYEVRTHWKALLAYGLIAMTGVQLFFFLSLQTLDVAVAIMLEMMGAPVMIVLWLWARTGQRPLAVTLLGVITCLVGVVLVLNPAGATNLHWIGVLWGMGAAACMAYYALSSSNHKLTLPPMAVTGLGMWIGAAGALALIGAQVLPVRWSTRNVVMFGTQVSWLVPAILLVIFTAGAYAFGILSLRRLGATVGAFVNLLEIPFSALGAWILVGEALGYAQLIGALVMLAGIALVKWGDVMLERRTAASSTAPSPVTGEIL